MAATPADQGRVEVLVGGGGETKSETAERGVKGRTEGLHCILGLREKSNRGRGSDLQVSRHAGLLCGDGAREGSPEAGTSLPRLWREGDSAIQDVEVKRLTARGNWLATEGGGGVWDDCRAGPWSGTDRGEGMRGMRSDLDPVSWRWRQASWER